MRTAWRDRAPLAALLALSIAFRLPALLDAGTVNSDAAIVGLQAMHFLRGELSWFLLGSGYQTSVDSGVAAVFFALLGATPLALVLSTFAGHLLATGLAHATLSRHVPRWTAAVATLPLVFTSSPLHTYILGPPRQASITLVFVALWAIDRGGAPRARAAWRVGGGVVASLACFADPYGLLFLPGALGLALLAAWDDPAPGRARRVAEAWGGALVGILPFLALVSSARSVHGEAALHASRLAHNAHLLVDPCLPWVLGATAFVPSDAGYVPWPAGAFRIVQLAGAWLFLGAIAWGVALAFRGRTPWATRRLGLVGAAFVPLTLLGFLTSVMVMDLFSARYLAAIVLMAPFALAPVAAELGAARLAATLAPFLLASAVSGWLGFGRDVSGLAPVRLPGGGAADEHRLARLLAERGITRAVADYWVSYRLTFLEEEALLVVPLHAAEDRYAPYRDAFDRAEKVAYVFDRVRSREALAPTLEELRAERTYGAPGETLVVGPLTAVVFTREAPRAP